MKTEFEASFFIISKSDMQNLLKSKGGTLVKKEFLQKRVVFRLPAGHEITGGRLRVRDEQDKVTFSLKIAKNNKKIEDQKEIELIVSNFEDACELLAVIGCEKKSYQENLREKWEIDGVEVTIDEWPYLEPFIEVEGRSEEAVQRVAEKLGFDYTTAYVGSVDGMYSKKYNISEDRINNNTPQILFNMDKNPFLN